MQYMMKTDSNPADINWFWSHTGKIKTYSESKYLLASVMTDKGFESVSITLKQVFKRSFEIDSFWDRCFLRQVLSKTEVFS